VRVGSGSAGDGSIVSKDAISSQDTDGNHHSQENHHLRVIDFFDHAYRNHKRYWQRPMLYSTNPEDFPPAWKILLEALLKQPEMRVLDLGAGEGIDAIRLARLGCEVDAVEGSAIGAEKIQKFAREAGVRLNVVHADARNFAPTDKYDIVICSGLLHYIEDKEVLLQKIQQATKVGGYNLMFLFSSYTAVPTCHNIVDIYCDDENGVVTSSYQSWHGHRFLEHHKLETAHCDFPEHYHSYIKILAQKPGEADDDKRGLLTYPSHQ
jgi:2-polyprenyl-3-methyl-5-hydroxy-6-metoxy-1,4-benzoquinol methylase